MSHTPCKCKAFLHPVSKEGELENVETDHATVVCEQEASR